MAEKTTFIDITSGDGMAITQLETDIADCLQSRCGFPGSSVRDYAVTLRRYLSDKGYSFEIPITVQEP